MLKFSLKIDDDKHSLTKEDGIPFDKVGELLQSLYAAIDPKSNIKCTLGQIRGNCYALDFYTEEERYETNFVIVHKNIEEIPFSQLEPSQKKYAGTLRKVLGDKYYINAYNNTGEKVASIKQIGTKEEFDVYYTTKTIYGIISQLGAPTLESPRKHINIDGIQYKIEITKDQDQELKHYYGSDKLRLRVRQKRSAEKGRVIDAQLISFTRLSEKSLIENLELEGYIDFALIKDTHTIEDIIDKIYTKPDEVH